MNSFKFQLLGFGLIVMIVMLATFLDNSEARPSPVAGPAPWRKRDHVERIERYHEKNSKHHSRHGGHKKTSHKKKYSKVTKKHHSSHGKKHYRTGGRPLLSASVGLRL